MSVRVFLSVSLSLSLSCALADRHRRTYTQVEDPPEELADTSLEAAAAAAAAAGEAGTSAAAAAAFVAATHSKQSSQNSKKSSRHEEASNPKTHTHTHTKHEHEALVGGSELLSSNVERVSNVGSGVNKVERKTGKTTARHRKRTAKDGLLRPCMFFVP